MSLANQLSREAQAVAPQRFDLLALPAQAWKNGAGVTREIAVGVSTESKARSADAFDWRISIADIDSDAPFSAFPGVDRCIVLLSGAGMRLQARDGSIDHHLVEPLAPFRFSGDAALDATLAGGACRDLNVMTRRGACRSEVSCHRGAAELESDAITLLFCSTGEWLVDTPGVESGTERLAPLHALLWRESPGAISVRPFSATLASALLFVRLNLDRRQ